MSHADTLARRRTGQWNKTLRAIGIALLASFAGCAPISEFIGKEPSPARVFSVGFHNLSDRYIEPVDMRKVVLSGLNSLMSMDSDLTVVHEEGAIRLLSEKFVAAQWTRPRAADPTGWAELAAKVVTAARVNSPIIRGRSNEDVYTAVFGGVLTHFDKYSRYSSAEKARRRQAARDGFGGLGISIDYKDGRTSIIEVHEETPAAQAGLLVKDVITHVAGKPIYGLSQREVVERLRGPIDSRVVLTLDRAGVDRPIEVAVTRALIVLPTVRAKVEDNILILKMSGFNQGTASAARRHMEAAIRARDHKLDGVILDLRGNPGGLLDQSVRVADLFLNEGLIISTKGRHRASEQLFDATWGEIAKGLRVAVLVNGKSASAAEIVAAALRDRGRAVVLGSSSYGKGSVQTILRLPNGGELTLTWAKLYTPAGFELQRRGVTPVICTNGSDKSAAELRKSLQSTLDQTQGTLLAQLKSQVAGRQDYRALRADCPPKSDKPKLDIEIARMVLTNGALYSKIVTQGRPSVASR